MATIKSHTDLEQSKKLTEILSLESADMRWIKMSEDDEPDAYRVGVLVNPELIGEDDIPCWSLAALLGVLDFPALRYDIENGEGGWIVGCEKNNKGYLSHYRDNPVDTCYEMIIHLHELKNK